MQEHEKALNFIVEIEKLKNVQRKTRLVGLDRYENSAEHSWHVCMSALMLKDYAEKDVNIDRVIKMLLIHDLGEIDAGEKITYKRRTRELKNKEADGVRRILGFLSEKTREEYMDLWYEFRSGETADSRYAKEVDKVTELLQDQYADCHALRENSIPGQKELTLNNRKVKISKKLWESIETKLQKAFLINILK